MDTKFDRFEFFCHGTGIILPVDFSHWGDNFGKTEEQINYWFQNCPFCHVPDHHEDWTRLHEWVTP
mgnify:CR=1 FL=1